MMTGFLHMFHRPSKHPDCMLCQTNGNPCLVPIGEGRICGRPLNWYGPHPHGGDRG